MGSYKIGEIVVQQEGIKQYSLDTAEFNVDDMSKAINVAQMIGILSDILEKESRNLTIKVGNYSINMWKSHSNQVRHISAKAIN